MPSIFFPLLIIFNAFILFTSEPLLSKALLPFYGGGPAVWNTCLVFFQLMLLFGYIFSHYLTKVTHVRAQAAILASLYTASWFLCGQNTILFIQGETSPTSLKLFVVLFTLFGIQFFTLSMCASLLQHWHAKCGYKNSYYLYSASNIGSLLGLLCFPFFIERFFSLTEQWTIITFGFAALSVASGLFVVCCRNPAHDLVLDHDTNCKNTEYDQRGRWIILSALPSGLLVCVTNSITIDISPMPLLWVIPLCIYLVTFILCFSEKELFTNYLLTRVTILLSIVSLIVIISEANQPPLYITCLHLLTLFFVCFYCHKILYSSRPHSRKLTDFYVCISIGGVVGGIIVTLIAPLLFTSYLEYPLFLIGSLLTIGIYQNEIIVSKKTIILALGILFITGITSYFLPQFLSQSGTYWKFLPLITFGIPALLTLYLSETVFKSGIAMSAVFIGSLFYQGTFGSILHSTRNYFGILRVSEKRSDSISLIHGRIEHGKQKLNEKNICHPLSYYHPDGPAGSFFQHVSLPQNANIGVIGLGIGSLACYGKTDQKWTFYEINPAVNAYARNTNYFTFLNNSVAQNKTILGDARLTLQNGEDRSYDLLVFDAFSSDSIPVYLLTKEAFSLYLQKLKPDGIVLFHISNLFLNLEPVLTSLIESENLLGIINQDNETTNEKNASTWVVASRSRTVLDQLKQSNSWHELEKKISVSWADERNSILDILNIKPNR